MNPSSQKTYKLGPAIRNICDELLNEINRAVGDMAKSKLDKDDKIREFKDKIKTNFHPLLKQAIKSFKSFIKLSEGFSNIECLNHFYQVIDQIRANLDFLNLMSDIYIFPEFNINDTIDFIFEGCTNDLRQKLINTKALDLIQSKNYYDNNDVRFMFNTDFNNQDYNEDQKGNIRENNVNIFLDKNNKISNDITKRISNKLEEFNKIIISKKNGFNEDNFKLYLDDSICIKLYNTFDIKFTISRLYFDIELISPGSNAIPYIILPFEIKYNNKTINLNDEEEKFHDKNELLSKNDLYFFIKKFKPKKDFSDAKDIIISSFSQSDFLEKCLLFKKFADELFNNKFEMIKKEIKNIISKYDFPITIEEKNNSDMELEDIDGINDGEKSINEITIYYNFFLSMKKKNEFYIKLIYNSEYPTFLKIVYSHFILKNNEQFAQKCPFNIIIEEKEEDIFLDLKKIKYEIMNSYEIYGKILINWIFKKLKYIYPIYFDICFIKKNFEQIIFTIKYNEKTIKLFSMFINDKGKFSYENLYTSKLFDDDFKEINNILTNYLKCDEDDEKFNEYIIQFNDYIKKIIIEKILIFSEDKIELIELNNNNKELNLNIYDSYANDKNLNTYFDIKFKFSKENNYIINKFRVDKIKLFCYNNKNKNQKIIFNCCCQNLQLNVQPIEKYQEYFRKLLNKLKLKYALYMTYAYDILKLASNPKSIFEFKKPFEIIESENTSKKDEDQYFEILDEKSDFSLFNNEYKEKLLNYFSKIKISRENNIFKLYMKDNIFKKKYSKYNNFFFENYATMFQNIILGYEFNEDIISITILGKMKIEYSNKIQMVFHTIIPNIMSYIDKIFKLIDYLLINDPSSIIRACPVYMFVQIVYGNDFKKHINFKFNSLITERDKFLIVDGNFNSIFNKYYMKNFADEIISGNFNYNDKDFFRKKIKNLFYNYKINDLLINSYKFKFSINEYPYNHFNQENTKIYCMIKDFNVINLIALNKVILTIQIRNDNSLYLEFRDKITEDLGNDIYSSFKNGLRDTNEDYKLNIEEKSNYNRIIILIDDESDDIKFSKLKKIINIIISLSNIN